MEKPYILIVDDEPETREIIYDVFEKDYVVDTATSGENAIEKIDDMFKTDRRFYDVVFLDIRMPGMGGLETLKRIKGRFIPFTTEILMLTAFDEAKLAWEAAQLGATDYITKPFDTDQLKLRASMAVERKRKIDDMHERAFIMSNLYKDGGKRKDLLEALLARYDAELNDIPVKYLKSVYEHKWNDIIISDVEDKAKQLPEI